MRELTEEECEALKKNQQMIVDLDSMSVNEANFTVMTKSKKGNLRVDLYLDVSAKDRLRAASPVFMALHDFLGQYVTLVERVLKTNVDIDLEQFDEFDKRLINDEIAGVDEDGLRINAWSYAMRMELTPEEFAAFMRMRG
jgi:hypothetical protein